jgi:hypothetical protein
MPLRKFLECNYGVSYREKTKEKEVTEEDLKKLEKIKNLKAKKKKNKVANKNK